MSNLATIDDSSWQVTVLPLPKQFSRGAAYGFCNGHPVGRAETARAYSYGCWWPDGQPEVLAFDEKSKDTGTGRAAAGDLIPGHRRGKDGALSAAVWKHQGDGLTVADLHDPAYQSTWATGAADGVVIGIGTPVGKPGEYKSDVGLVWRGGPSPAKIEGMGDVRLLATDGVRFAGSAKARAMLWPELGSAPIDLAPDKMHASEIEALDGEWQIGNAWRGMCARAGLWRGTAASFSDLTPKGFETSRANGGVNGFQVGSIRRKDTTRDGSTGSDNVAVLWQGAADRWIDLNALLLAKEFNASMAWAILLAGNEIRICGEASRYEVRDSGTKQESHYVPVARPVLWTARLRPG